MKNIAIFCDGTWQHMDQPHPTNVAILARATLARSSDGAPQVVYYDDGVGVGEGVLDQATHLLGGAMGEGLDYKIMRAYEFLALNYDTHDRVFILGFSRGAYTARSLGGLIRWFGVLKRENAGRMFEAMSLYRGRPPATADKAATAAFEARAAAFRASYSHHAEAFTAAKSYRPADAASLTPDADCAWIQYMGVWDTVGSLGVPTNLLFAPLLNAQYRFHDTSLSRAVRSARHAVAIDERRKTFSPTLWDNIDALNANAQSEALAYDQRPYQQQWFPGGHGCVGGGSPDGWISLVPMLWVAEGAARAGLAFDHRQIDRCAALANPCAAFVKAGFDLGELVMELAGMADRRGPLSFEEASLSARLRWAGLASYRPPPLRRSADVERDLDAWRPSPDPQPYFRP